MKQISKKAITIITATSAVLISTATILANVLIKDEQVEKRNHNPLDRDNTYHHYSISNKVTLNDKLNNLIDIQADGKTLFYVINEEKFLSNFQNIIRETLKTISLFSSNYLNYEITCNYLVKDNSSIEVDLVWKLPNNNVKYYDQFELLLKA